MAEKISLADQAYHTMKERILNLTYPPGMQLTETMLAEELNMSRNPIRTALKTLHAEGLVVRDYYKSIIVKEITDKDIEEIYQLRELLEGAAFREIFTSGRADEFPTGSRSVSFGCVRVPGISTTGNWRTPRCTWRLSAYLTMSGSIVSTKCTLTRSSAWGCIPSGMVFNISRANENLKKMIRYMRSDQYEKAYEILRNESL